MFKKFMKTLFITAVSASLLCSGIITRPVTADAASGQHAVFDIFYETADILGVDEQTVINKIGSGSTLAEVAESYEISETTLIVQLEDRAKANIDTSLADGAITQSQASNLKLYVTSMIKTMVENKYTSSNNILYAPEGLNAVSKSKSSITLSWDSVSGASHYYIFRSSSVSGTFQKIADVNTSYYTNKALKKGTTYYYKVKAVNSLGESGYSYVLKAKVGSSSNSLSRPSGLTAKAESKTQISLKWNYVSNADEYYIYRATSASGTYTKIASASGTSYADNNLSENTSYYYKIQAVNNTTQSEYSTAVAMKTQTSVLAAPANLRVSSVNGAKVSLEWNSVTNATSYNVYRSSSSSGTYTKMLTVSATSYTDSSLSNNTTYYYKVKAVNNSSESDYSSVATATTGSNNSDLDSPDDLTAESYGDDEITLDWDSVDDAEYYYIYRSTSSSGTYDMIERVDETSYTDEDLRDDTTYYYKVKAYDGHDTSDFSSSAHASTGDGSGNNDLDAPDDLTISDVSHDSISLEWDSVSDADKYYVYRSDSSSGDYNRIAVVDDTDYTDDGLREDKTYYYKVKSYDGDDTSEYSDIVHATTDED
jgi:fibronectin type 3 domain-containing protein